MEEKIKFGIYTSFYNCERFVESAFQNIERIRYENFEWHITDDFSRDNTKSLVIERIKSSPIRERIFYVEQDSKKQMYWKPNEFFDQTFEWIVLVDADDLTDPDFLSVYNKVLSESNDVGFVSADFHKVEEQKGSLHSISYILNDRKLSDKIERYHPEVDYLRNLSYSCFGHLRAFRNYSHLKFEIDMVDAGAEDSYHVFWANSEGKYLHIPRPLYKWFYREDSESHSAFHNPNFNGNFDIAYNKLLSSDKGIDTRFNPSYLETSALGSHFLDGSDQSISLFTGILSDQQEDEIRSLYPGNKITFNSSVSDVNFVVLNYYDSEDLGVLLDSFPSGSRVVLYFQNNKTCFSNESKDRITNEVLEKYSSIIIEKLGGYSYFNYIRHLIIKVNI